MDTKRVSEAYDKTWDDPMIQDRSKRKAREHYDEIEQAKEQLKEMKPDFENALDFLEQENLLEMERGKQHELTIPGPGGGFCMEL